MFRKEYGVFTFKKGNGRSKPGKLLTVRSVTDAEIRYGQTDLCFESREDDQLRPVGDREVSIQG